MISKKIRETHKEALERFFNVPLTESSKDHLSYDRLEFLDNEGKPLKKEEDSEYDGILITYFYIKKGEE